MKFFENIKFFIENIKKRLIYKFLNYLGKVVVGEIKEEINENIGIYFLYFSVNYENQPIKLKELSEVLEEIKYQIPPKLREYFSAQIDGDKKEIRFTFEVPIDKKEILESCKILLEEFKDIISQHEDFIK